MVLLFFSLLPTCVKAATYNFNKLYKGTGSAYGLNTQSITGINPISATSIQFFQNGAQFSGNSINGVLTYYDNTNQLKTIYGNLNRQDKSGSTSLSFYFIVSNSSFTTFTGEAYLFVVPGKESSYTTGATVTTSSDPVAAALNAVVASAPNITTVGTLNSFSTCIGISSSTQTLTVSGTSLTAPISIAVPLGYEVSSTSPSGGFSSTLTLAPTSGTVNATTLYLRLKGLNSGLAGSISFTSTNAGTILIPLSGVVNVLPTITSTTNGFSENVPDIVQLSASASSGALVDWYDALSSGTQLLAGSNTYSTTSISITTIYYVQARNTTTGCISSARTAVTATIGGKPPPTLNLTASLTPFITCIGQPSTEQSFTVSGSDLNSNDLVVAAPSGYEISLISGTVSGSTFTSTIVIANSGNVSSTTIFIRLRSNAIDGATGNISASCISATTKTSNIVPATVNPLSVAGSISGGGINVCSGLNTNDLILSGNTGTIQWQSSINGSTFNDITGEVTSSLTTGNLTQTTYYRAVVTSGSCSSIASGTATINVNPTSVAGTISGTTTVCSGTSGKVVSLTENTGTIQWQSSIDGSAFNDISGQVASTLTTGTLTQTTYYRAVVTSGSCSSIASETATITVSPTSIAGTISGTTTVCSGTSGKVISLTGNTGTIQWQSSIDGLTFNNIAGEVASTLTTGTISQTTYYRAVVTSGSCSSIPSGTATLTFVPASNAGTINGGGVSVCSSVSNSTTLTLNGYVGAIQWQSSSDNITFVNITSATTANYIATNLTTTSYYRAIVTSGLCSAAISGSTGITVGQCLDIDPDINATNINTIVMGNLSTNDKITDGTTYSNLIPLSNNPNGATIVLKSDGTYTFTSTTIGRYIYYVTVCAAGQTTNCEVSTLEITVTDPSIVNNPPITKNDYATSKVNTPVSVKVLSNDKVANPGTSLLPSSMSIPLAPVNGTASVDTTTGIVTFVPNNGFNGSDSLNYKVCDNSNPSNCQVATVYLKIKSSSIAEYTTTDDDFNKVDMNTDAIGNVLINDFNSSNNTLSVILNSTPNASQGTITFKADGSYTFTPKLNFYGPIDISYTACTVGSVCATATLHILLSPVKPVAPKPNGGTYTTKDPSNPSNISSTVTNIPAGSKVIYCDVNGLSCENTAPVLPTKPGIYVWCIKSLDTITNLTSTPCVYDTIRILPVVIVVNATYVNNVITNPKNIAGLVSDITLGSVPKWCDVNGNNCTTTAPALPKTNGQFVWCVKALDTASGLLSANCKMDTVTIIDPFTIMELSKVAKSVKLNPDGTIMVTFVMQAKNKTNALMDNVSIKDDLARTFNTTSGMVIYSLEAFGGLIKNAGYDGISNIDLVSAASKLESKKTDSLILKVLLESPTISGNLLNVASLAGSTQYGKVSVLSNDPILNTTDTAKRLPTAFIIPKVEVVIAGGFSPNQDGMNDKWIIIRPFGTTIHVKVFNRWGNLVYENENYINDWDGRGQGDLLGKYLPEGTYFYMVEAIDASGNIQKFVKNLTIAR
jgi:gliding motility-associated-like protein